MFRFCKFFYKTVGTASSGAQTEDSVELIESVLYSSIDYTMDYDSRPKKNMTRGKDPS